MSNMPRPRSPENNFKSIMYTMLIFAFLLYLIQILFEFLFSPLLDLITPKETEEKIREKIEEKQEKREEKDYIKQNDVNDPMYQFRLRFITQPKKYINDTGNKIYEEWFQAWKQGSIRDTNLSWAPSVFSRHTFMRKNFIDYMKIQWDTHSKESSFKQWLFCETIRKYYPEITPTMKGIEYDLAYYEAEINEEHSEGLFYSEIDKLGLPNDIAMYLLKADVTKKDLKEKTVRFKDLLAKGFNSEICIFGVKENLDDNVINILHIIHEKTGLSPEIGLAYANREITIGDIESIVANMENMLDSYGKKAFQDIKGKNTTPFQEYLTLLLGQKKETNALKQYMTRKVN